MPGIPLGRGGPLRCSPVSAWVFVDVAELSREGVLCDRHRCRKRTGPLSEGHLTTAVRFSASLGACPDAPQAATQDPRRQETAISVPGGSHRRPGSALGGTVLRSRGGGAQLHSLQHSAFRRKPAPHRLPRSLRHRASHRTRCDTPSTDRRCPASQIRGCALSACTGTLQRDPTAADLLFLNNACFNGLMRFNRKGGFDTPKGKNDERFTRRRRSCEGPGSGR